MAGMVPHVMGILVTCGALALLAFSFATNSWQTVMVKRDNIQAFASASSDNDVKQALEYGLALDPAFTSRTRGLFFTCYFFDNSVIDWRYDNTSEDQLDGNCLAEKGYELSRRPSTVAFGYAYDTRIQLMRCHFAFYVIALAMYLGGAITSAYGCCCIRAKLLQLAGAMNFGAAFFAAAAIAFWHGYLYLETKFINQPIFPYYYLSRSSLFSGLIANWNSSLGYSYILGWLGIGVGLIGGILFFTASSHVTVKKLDDEKKRRQKEKELEAAQNPSYEDDEIIVLPGEEPELRPNNYSSDSEDDAELEPEPEIEPVPVPIPVPVPYPAYGYSTPPSLIGLENMQAPLVSPMYGMFDGYPAAVLPPPSYPYDVYNSRL